MDFIKLTGKLVYEPKRNDFRKQHKARTLIVDLPRDDLTALYRSFVKSKYLVDLQPPMWGNHVTVVRGDERPAKPDAWKAHAGETVEILVSPHIYKNWDFWVLPVKCPRLADLRAELGLKAFHDLHLTIGREFPDNRRLWTHKQLSFLQRKPDWRFDDAPVIQAAAKPIVQVKRAPRVWTVEKA